MEHKKLPGDRVTSCQMTTPEESATADGPAAREESLSTALGVPAPRAFLRTVVVGLCMGTADAVPGVSGGTIALIAGVYERLIAAITALTPRRGLRAVGAFLPVDGGFFDDDGCRALREMDVWFLGAIGVGVVTAVVLVSRAVHWLDEHYPVVLFGFFFGLIVASAVILLRAIDLTERAPIAAFLGAVAVAAVVSLQSAILASGGLALVFLAGIVGVSAMILPGISGSLLLVILGQYTRLSGELSTFVDRLLDLARGGSVEPLFGPGSVVVTFVAGGFVGLLTVSRVVTRALERNRTLTLAALVGLVVGALVAPVTRIQTEVGFDATVLAVFVGTALLGAVVVLGIDRFAVDLEL